MTGETETRVTGEVGAQVAEEIGIGAPDDFDAPAAEPVTPAPKLQHTVPDRGRARDLFEQLCALPVGDSERLRIRAELVELHLPLVEYLARRFRNRGEWLDDLTQVATIGLIKSIDRFDLARGVEFSTYATPTIVGEIKRHFRDKGWAIRIPRGLQELNAKMSSTIERLTARLGHSPSIAEIAHELQTTPEQVLEAMEAGSAYAPVSLSAGPSGEGELDPMETIGTEDLGFERTEQRASLEPALELLPEREREILRMRFEDGLTQTQIAEQVGVSQMHVSRLIRKSLARMRAELS